MVGLPQRIKNMKAAAAKPHRLSTFFFNKVITIASAIISKQILIGTTQIFSASLRTVYEGIASANRA